LGSAARIFSNRVIFFETSSGEAALLALLASSISAALVRGAGRVPEPSGAGCAGSVCAAAGRLSAAVNSSADSKRFFMADWLCRLISVGR